MSRIGKQPVSIPDKVKIDIIGTTVSVEGPKGKVSKTFAPVVKMRRRTTASSSRPRMKPAFHVPCMARPAPSSPAW